MKRIGVISDTHSREIPGQALEDFRSVEFIIHAGDFCLESDFNKLAKVNALKAVYGNMDEPALRHQLPRRQILAWEGFRIGIFHGDGPPQKLLALVRDEFKDDKVDVIIFGHSHHPMNEKINDVLWFNPGSPNDTVIAPYCSYGILEVHDKEIVGKIIKIKG